MYLKSLTLKGFKSFADRSQLVFEPGLTVIVGPNGSGKSNISDAILWVLGEQSAKQLRGQAMEDVIFSGSSARKAVGVAEVTLVLDNSDHLLPVDFDEVAITRRMYRSGESEYLINASPCRLMDIQDILHDTGLGKETYSIISQGKLDSILQSRPEDRRALIEEAAGISKHKRRKLRAEKKLASMDESLARARDVSRELKRQLRPLERQVDRAKRYEELSARATELTRILAVDELRQLQASWADIERAGKEADAELELARYRRSEKERELERLQVMLEEKGLFVGDLSEQRRHMQDVVGRIGSDMRLLEEKGRNMVSRLSDTRSSISSYENQLARVRRELSEVQGQLDEERGAKAAAQTEVDELSPSADELHARRTALDEKVSRLGREQRAAQQKADAAALKLARVRETISNAEVQDGLYAGRLEQVDDEIGRAQEALDGKRERAEELEDELEGARARLDEAESGIETAEAARDAVRARETEAREALSRLRSELAGLERLDASLAGASDLTERLEQGLPEGSTRRLVDAVEAPEELEGLVELLLGSDIDALVLDGDEELRGAARAAEAAEDVSGAAALVSRDAPDASDHPEAPGYRLIDRLRVEAGYEGAVSAILGGIRVVDSLDEALGAPALPGATYVTASGVRVAGGVVRAGSETERAEGVLERKRRIRELRDAEPDASAALDRAARQAEEAAEALEAARSSKAAAEGEISRLEGERTSLLSEIGRLEHSLSQSQAEKKRLVRKREETAAAAAKAAPEQEGLAAERDEAQQLAERLTAERDEAADELDRVRKDDADAAGRLSEAKVRLARATERERGLSERVPALERRVAGLERRISAARDSSRSLDVLCRRVDPLHDRYDALSKAAEDWARRLRDQASIEQADSESLKKTIADAKEEVAHAKEAVEEAQAAVNDAKVARGKLEVQVQNAVDAITADGGITLEEALKLPAPDDRATAEHELEDLARQINNLGPVNHAAMEEYERLKERSDYVEAQLADLESARTSLAKVSAAIDRKMRRAFLSTYDEVDHNFQEVFAMLFPGGQAHLEMTDPDHPDTTGIEVVAQPRGKRVTKMSLLSGGEKSLTALALLFAVYRTRTVPFYVLDEVEAALDDSNLGKFIDALDTLRDSTQLLVISHQRRTMEHADVLYGVSMQADGVSRVVSQRLDRETGKVVDAS